MRGGEFMTGALFDIPWQELSVVIVLALVLYTGHKGYWYWSPGVRALATELARERDDWRCLAVTLLRKEGVPLPEGFEQSQSILLPGEMETKGR